MFIIEDDNNITAVAPEAAASTKLPEGAVSFATKEEFDKATAAWPLGRLAGVWNSFAGTPGFDQLKPVRKLESRANGIARIWAAIQRLNEAPTSEAKELPDASAQSASAPPAAAAAPTATTRRQKAPKTPKPATTKAPKAPKQPRAARAAGEPKAERKGTKKAEAIRLLSRKNGASNQEMQDSFGWLPHTCRGFLAGTLKKAGYTVESYKTDAGERRYRIAS